MARKPELQTEIFPQWGKISDPFEIGVCSVAEGLITEIFPQWGKISDPFEIGVEA